MKAARKGQAPSLQSFSDIAANIRPLADFYRNNRPQVKAIRLFAQDFAQLVKWPKKAGRAGFRFTGNKIYFHEFELLSETDNG